MELRYVWLSNSIVDFLIFQSKEAKRMDILIKEKRNGEI